MRETVALHKRLKNMIYSNEKITNRRAVENRCLLFSILVSMVIASISSMLGSSALAMESGDVVTIYNEEKSGDLQNIMEASNDENDFGGLKKGSHLIILGSLIGEDYQDTVYFNAEGTFTVRVIDYVGDTKSLSISGFSQGATFEKEVGKSENTKKLYQGKVLDSGRYRFDFGKHSNTVSNQDIGLYAIHIYVDTKRNPNEAPIQDVDTILSSEHGSIQLGSGDGSGLEAFLETAKNLPNTRKELQHQFNILPSVRYDNHFVTLQQQYASLNADVTMWKQETYPSITQTAGKILEANARNRQLISSIQLKLSDLYELIDFGQFIIDDIEKKRNTEDVYKLISTISSLINTFDVERMPSELMALSIREKTFQFASVITEHKSRVGEIYSTFNDLLSQDNTLYLKKKISQLNRKIKIKNKQIAEKKRRLALSSIGGFLSKAIASSILVSRINALKSDRNKLIRQRNNRKNQLRQSMYRFASYEKARDSIGNVMLVTKNATPYFDYLRWRSQSLSSRLFVIDDLTKEVIYQNDAISAYPVIFYDVVKLIIDRVHTETSLIDDVLKNV